MLSKTGTCSLLQPVPTERMCSLLKTVGGFFPGMALAWRISQEKFMKQTEDWLDNLKLRVSYGSVGNARVNSYWRQDYKMESSANRQYYLNETVQSALKLQNTLRNENLTWETESYPLMWE